MNEAITRLHNEISHLSHRYTDENRYECRAIFNNFHLFVKDLKNYDGLYNELSELDNYVETFMDLKSTETRRKEAYKIIHEFLRTSINQLYNTLVSNK